MKSTFFFLIVSLVSVTLWAQTDSTIKVNLDQYAKDDRFDKFQLTLALFLAKGDTLLTMDYEGTRKVKPFLVKRPEGYKYYAYGYLFFNGIENKENPGYITALVGNPYHKNPKLYLDVNNNHDFTDDTSYTLPYFDEEPLMFELANAKYPQGKIKVVLSRNKLFGQKYDFKKYMDEYYEMSFKDRQFIGAEYTYREQKFIARIGQVKLQNESFKIALLDANTNGIYNEPEIDKVMFINTRDTLLDATNPLNFVTIAKAGQPTYFEKNGRTYKVIEADIAGNYIVFKPTTEQAELNKLKIGSKAPKVKFTLAKGEKLKLNKFKRKEVYLYFGSRNSKNFKSDTMLLRQLAALDTNNLKVIMVLYVNKSYELRIYNSDAKPNYHWLMALKN